MTKVYSDPANYSTVQHHRRSNPVSYDVRFQDIGRINLMTEMGAFRPGARQGSELKISDPSLFAFKPVFYIRDPADYLTFAPARGKG